MLVNIEPHDAVKVQAFLTLDILGIPVSDTGILYPEVLDKWPNLKEVWEGLLKSHRQIDLTGKVLLVNGLNNSTKFKVAFIFTHKGNSPKKEWLESALTKLLKRAEELDMDIHMPYIEEALWFLKGYESPISFVMYKPENKDE